MCAGVFSKIIFRCANLIDHNPSGASFSQVSTRSVAWVSGLAGFQDSWEADQASQTDLSLWPHPK